MSDYIKIALRIVWAVLSIYWLITSFKTKEHAQMESFIKRFVLYWLPLIVAALLLGPGEWFGHTIIRENFVPHSNMVGIAGLILSVFGVALACWSRYLLGQNWSLSVQLKHDHKLIVNGPYSYVRHPIYSGLLLLFLGNAIVVGDWRGLIAVALVFISFWFKLLKEEKWMISNFGVQYQEYMRTTKALFPWII
jgi:protein-S-isoprenylcysteine O-methyltransferase Ste14